MRQPRQPGERVARRYGTTGRCWTASRSASATGDRIGVVGRNGGGKTTLLRLLAGAEAPDAGRVTRTGGLRIGYLDQGDRPRRRPHRARRSSLGGTRRARVGRRRRGPRGARRRSGCRGSAWTPRSTRLSGGERRRVALAAAAGRATPTCWCSTSRPTTSTSRASPGWPSTCAARRGALVVVTHDRWFLDAVCTRTWEVADGAVRRATTAATPPTCWPGPSAPRQAGAAEARRQNLLRKELAWLRRGPPARTSKPQFRIEAAEGADRRRAAAARPRRAAALRHQPARASTVLDARGRRPLGASATADAARPTSTWRLGPGDRVGDRRRQRLGQDARCCGCWPASCARRAARCGVGQTVRVGYLSRSWPSCPDELRVLEAVERGRAAGRELGGGRAVRVASWPSGSASPASGSGRRSATCPAASGAGCSCCGC